MLMEEIAHETCGMSEVIHHILQALSCGQKYLKLGLRQRVGELKLHWLYMLCDLTLSSLTL